MHKGQYGCLTVTPDITFVSEYSMFDAFQRQPFYWNLNTARAKDNYYVYNSGYFINIHNPGQSKRAISTSNL